MDEELLTHLVLEYNDGDGGGDGGLRGRNRREGGVLLLSDGRFEVLSILDDCIEVLSQGKGEHHFAYL
jgi:hypothetical protein